MNAHHHHRLKHTPAYARHANRRVYSLTPYRGTGLPDRAALARIWPRGGFLPRKGHFPA